MLKYKKKFIRDLVSHGAAEDITDYGFDKMHDFIATHGIERIGYSTGVYGINGGLLCDVYTGKLYAITARCTALSMVF